MIMITYSCDHNHHDHHDLQPDHLFALGAWGQRRRLEEKPQINIVRPEMFPDIDEDGAKDER